ncbi:hypothetical protein F5B19DRAFT_365143 [Rostrohypoxylon terebratum]|nr:hypothetical protein F5B19DRAFT_365143 [Rostrohypoxylon terebratum]
MSSRNTRARSRANAGTSAGSTAPDSRQSTYSEPPTVDLPSLYPMHDGSYGVNTHANLENVRRRGKKLGSNIVNEDDEDRRFTRRMRSRDGGRLNMENDLQRVAEETVEEAGKDDRAGEDYQAMGNEPSQQAGPREPYIPTHSGRKFLPNPNTTGAPPHHTTRYRSVDPGSLIHDRQPVVPLTNPTPFFGLPTGSGYVDDNASQRPSSAKSFNGESTLYGDASVYTPRRPSTSKPQDTSRPQETSAPVQPVPPAPPAPPEAPAAPISPTSDPAQRRLDWDPSVYQEPNLLQASTEQRTYEQPKPTYEQPTSEEASNERPVHENPTYEQPYEQPTYEPPTYQQTFPQHLLQQLSPGPITTNSVQGSNQSPNMEKANPNPNKDYYYDKISNVNIDSSGKSTPQELSPEVRKSIENLRLSMLLPPARESVDMGNPAMETSAPDEFNKAANQFGLGSNSATFTNQPQPLVEEIGPVNNTELLTPNSFIPQSQAPTFQEQGESADYNTGDDSTEEYTSDLPATGRPMRRIPRQPIPPGTYGPAPNRPSRRKRPSWTRRIADKWDTIFFFVTILTGVWVGLAFINHDPAPVRGGTLDRPEWVQWGTIRDGILRHIPSVPSVPSRVKSPLGTFWDSTSTSDRTGAHVVTSMPIENIVEDLSPRLPETVFVSKDKLGKPKISQDFWHALRRLMQEDDIILTLNQAAKDGATISDAHWRAIENRLRTSGLLKPANATGVNTGLVQYASHSKQCVECWDKWISNNNDALKKAISGIALTKVEFLELFTKEINSRSQQVNSALKNANDRIEQLQQEITKLKDAAPASPGLPKAEIQQICDAAIAKAIKDIKMGAIAEGQIRGHAQDLFANQVNFFGHGSGALIDPTYSSKPWQIPRDYYKTKSKEWRKRDGWTTQPVRQAIAPWFEEGECFCAGPKSRGLREETVSVHVMMSRNIIPQNLVVEHILPGSTLDPGARPRDIEVWANIDEITLREEVLAFSKTNFPTTEPEKTLNEAYVKIGHFVYQDVNTGDGIQIFKFSDELIRMNAYTPSVVVRTISNYGADHTCFYRLRLYGEVVEVEP